MSATAAVAAETHGMLAPERAALATGAAEILRAQVEIARIASPTFGEHRRAAWVGERLAQAGCDVRSDSAGNVIARLRGQPDGPPLAVCAHLDTVYPGDPAVDVRTVGSRVVGSGICDNGRGLAALVTLAALLQPRAGTLRRPIEFVGTTGEEGAGDLLGAKRYVEDNAPVGMIALDGAGDERIVNTALGSRRFRITFDGPGGHSWSAFGAANAVHAAARCATSISGLALPANVAVTVSRIGGGAAINAVPESAWLEVDVRGVSEAILSTVESQVRRAAAEAAREENARRRAGDALRHEVRRVGHRGCGVTPVDSPLVEAAREGTRLVSRRAELAVASTDANAAIAAGIPAIAIGAGGRGGDVHSSHEWFDDANGTVGVERALTIIASAARLETLSP